MNYIKQLQTNLHEAFDAKVEARMQLTEILSYLASDKFKGDGNDYVHVSTDIYPKLIHLRNMLI